MSFTEVLIATGVGITIVSIVPKIYKYIKAKIKGETTESDKSLEEMNKLGYAKYRQWYLNSIKKQIKEYDLQKHELFDKNSNSSKEPNLIRKLLIKENRKQIRKYNINEAELF